MVTEKQQECVVEHPPAHSLVTPEMGTLQSARASPAQGAWGAASCQPGKEGQPKQQHGQNASYRAHGHQPGKHKQRMKSESQK